MKIEFRCKCGQDIVVPQDYAGKESKCPKCENTVIIPLVNEIDSIHNSEKPTPKPDAELSAHCTEIMFCSQCGKQNKENNFKCTGCGFVLHGPSQPRVVVTADATMGGLIPYKNAQALWAYYLGVFSLIPCFGIPLGIAALVLGIRGLSYAEEHMEAKGKAHAWAGIALGGLCVISYALLILGLFMIGTSN